MDIDRFKKFPAEDRWQEKRLADHLVEMEGQGLTLTTLELAGECYDEPANELRWELVTVRNWRTKEVLGTYDHESFWELDYSKERWYDAEHYYE